MVRSTQYIERELFAVYIAIHIAVFIYSCVGVYSWSFTLLVWGLWVYSTYGWASLKNRTMLLYINGWFFYFFMFSSTLPFYVRFLNRFQAHHNKRFICLILEEMTLKVQNLNKKDIHLDTDLRAGLRRLYFMCYWRICTYSNDTFYAN
jgi:hypothetical protein